MSISILSNTISLEIPYDLRAEAKKYKCFYNPDQKLWSCKYNDDNDDYDKKQFVETYQQVFLNVLYSDKDDAKANGAKWSSRAKSWYTYKGNDALKKYMIC